MSTKLARQLVGLLEPLAASHGLDLVEVEALGGGRSRTVRIYLDAETGINIDIIAAANAWVSEALDGVAELSGPYTLEVSSPGLDRILRTADHFRRFTGERISLQSTRPVDGRSRFTGELAGLDGDDVRIVVDGVEHRVPLDSLERARLKPDFSASGHNGLEA